MAKKYVYKFDMETVRKNEKRGIGMPVGFTHAGKSHKVDAQRPQDFVLETSKAIPDPSVHQLVLVREEGKETEGEA